MKRILSVILTLFLLVGLCMPAFAAEPDAQEAADHLYALGLFKGTGTDASGEPVFELGRAPKRSEAVTMLVRLLGKEDEAVSSTWTTPFTDVPKWALPYVGYAYENGLTNGVSATEFGSDGQATATMYITFVLRALGYDSSSDFKWNAAWELSDKLGITDGSYNASTNAGFTRGDVAIISESALDADYKGGESTLLDKLIADGAVKTDEEHPVDEAPADAAEPADAEEPGEKTVLNSEQIYARCMPAVFYIEVYDDYGNAIASGSGFFIDDEGTAVTNHHVIYGATSAKVTLSDSAGNDLETLDVLGVYAWSEQEDWAILKVDTSGNSFLKIGDPATAAGGAQVYALGSPLGLSASISDGMISNPARVLDGQTYIQISAPISHGSSGGALVNKYGEVIGITAAGFDDGQNLNLAVPISKIANAAHDLLTPISDTYVIASGIVYPSERYVTLRPGQTLDNIITARKYDTEELLTVQYEIDDETFVTCSWDSWGVDDEEVTLHMTAGSSFGSTTVWIYLLTQDSGELLDYDYIYVTVAGGELTTNKSEVNIDLSDPYGIVWITANAFDGRSFRVRYTDYDKELINCAWGEWDKVEGGHEIPLYIAAQGCGGTELRFEMFDSKTEEILTTASVYVFITGGHLTLSDTYLTMGIGETQTVTISGTPSVAGTKVHLATDEFLSDVIDWQRGTLSGNPAQLTITALSDGWDCIYVTLCDEDDNELCSEWINVDVLAGRVTAVAEEEITLKKGESTTVYFDTEVFDGRAVTYKADSYDAASVSCTLGDATADGRIPVTVTGLDYGSAYVGLEMYDAETEEFLAGDGVFVRVVGGTLTFSEAPLMLAPGESRTVTITGTPFNAGEKVYIETDQFSSSTIDWQRGKQEGNPAQLTITALAEGYDIIFVALYNEAGELLVEETYEVYVNMDGKGADE